MEKHAIFLGFFDKQIELIQRLFNEISEVDLTVYEKRYLFALKTQQLYTAIEDLLKQIAKAFENHIEDLSCYHKELLSQLNTDIPKIRPAALGKTSFLFLDKLRTFSHFICHAYDCELIEMELRLIQERLKSEFSVLIEDLARFKEFVQTLA